MYFKRVVIIMKKNILFVVDERKMGGVSVLFEDMMTLIDITNYNIDLLILHNNGDSLQNLPKSINIIYGTPYFEAIDYTMKDVITKKNINLLFKKIRVVLDMKTGRIEKVIKRERKKILKKQYDTEIAFKDGFTALFTIFGDSKKKIHWLQYEYKKTNPNQKYDKLFKKVLPQFDEIVAVSDNVKKCFNEVYNLGDKVSVIYNVINQNKILKKADEECDLVLDCNNINIVSVGRLHQAKGYDRLINVVAKLKDFNAELTRNLKIYIYGDGPLFFELKKLIDDLNLNDIIILVGKVANPYKYIKNFDLFVLPSNFEAFGLVIIEAMTLKIPVLATETSITDKLINSDVNGLVVENSVDGIYDGLKKIIENRELITKYKNNLADYFYDNNEQLEKIKQILD